MEDVISDQDDLANPPPFWCHICRISCESVINLHSHFLGSRHKKAEEALKNNQEGGGDQPKAVESLEEQINACKNAEPALGLEYIYEFQNHGYSRYECRLCNCFLGRTHMFMHIVGARHRIYYLSKHHPSMGITNAYILKGPKKLKKLRDICVRVEKEFGRKQINVVKGDVKMFSCDAQMPPPCVNYQLDSKLQDIDFTNDEFLDIEEKPATEEHVVTFLELKAAHDASLKDQAIGQENLQQAAGQGKDHEEKQNKPDNSDGDIDTCDVECTNDLDAFPSNRELFQYLESFKVFELGDVHFLLKVSEKLRNVLVCHKEDGVERKKMEVNSNGQDENINQCVVPSLEHCVTNHESEFSNKKVSFRISGPSTEKKTLVSTPLLSHIQQDVQEKKFLSLNLSNQSASIARHQLSKSPERADAAFGRGPFPKENMKGSSILTPSKSSSPLELTVNSAGSVTTHAENIHEDFKNFSCFPSPIAPSTTEQTRNSSVFPPRSPNAQESIRDSAGVAFLRPPSSKMFRNVRGLRIPNPYREIGSYPASINFRGPFPPWLNPAVRASPPVAKDDVTAKFFESIKDMEVSEVVSTLNKITATNPALQGIHVPSLVQYLMDTGKLKSSSNQEKK